MPGKQKPMAQKRREKGLPPFAPGSSPKGGRPPHMPTDELRKKVELMAAIGFPHEMMATVMQIEVETLLKHYRAEVDTGEANMLLLAGNTVAAGLTKKEPWAAQYVLSHKGKRLGWTKGTELTGAGGKGLFDGLNLGALNDAQFQALKELLKLAGAPIQS